MQIWSKVKLNKIGFDETSHEILQDSQRLDENKKKFRHILAKMRKKTVFDITLRRTLHLFIQAESIKNKKRLTEWEIEKFPVCFVEKIGTIIK